jgi:serine/threonine-protein kinase
MGVVYLATQAGLDRKVALKVLTGELSGNPEFVERFHREAVVLASLDSPHIITIHDHGEANGVLYLATQYVSGGDLGAHIKAHGPMPSAQALTVFAQILVGLRDAHSRGVIHRDIKPGNVLLRDDRDEPYAYLADFGIAQSEAAVGQTRTGVVAGSVPYLAPERLVGEPASVQSDLYAAGCVLWMMLTGSTPYAGTEFQQAQGHSSGPIPQLLGGDHTTAALNRLLAWTLAKNPADRPRTAAELLAATREVEHSLAPDDRTRLRPTVIPEPSPAASSPIAVDRSEPTRLRDVPVPPVAADARPRRSRKLPIAIAVAAVTVVAVVAGVAVWLGSQKAEPAAAGESSPTVAVSTSAEPKQETSEPKPETSEPTAATTTALVCWDGSPTADLDTCPSPTTAEEVVEYLRYVYPNQEAITDRCTVTDSTKHYSALTVYRACWVGEKVEVVTRYWTSSDDARKLYDTRFKGNTRASYDFYIGDTKADGRVRTTKRPVESEGALNLIVLWADDQLAISIFAQTSQDLWDTLEQLEVVIPEQILGYPEENGGATTGPAGAR